MLYMLAMHSINILTGENLHLIKIGHTDRAVRDRLNQYKTYNPMATVIATRNGTTGDEASYHFELAYKCNGQKYFGEWYAVSEDVFNMFIKNGFKVFRKNAKNKFMFKAIREV